MPELPEVEAVRRQIAPAMVGARISRVTLRRDNLRTPFPPRFADRLRGRIVRSLDRRGKYLIAELSSGERLVMHLGMSGSFRAERSPTTVPHDHVVFTMSSGIIVTFNDPRRFGLMTLVTKEAPAGHAALAAMGPEPLSDSFNADTLAAACAGKRVSLKVALLDQRVVAGLGNIYASEALHVAGLSPRRRASTIATRGGAPRESAVRLAAAIKQVLREAIARKETAYRASRFRVYDREGEPCRTKGCKGAVRRITQAGRSTFFCPECQR